MDLLVRLYDLPAVPPPAQTEVRRAFAAEKEFVCDWVRENFSRGWASECAVAFARTPVACFVATAGDVLTGFACYDASARGFLGPTAVDETARHRGIGGALFLATLRDMAANGYGYAVIGDVSSTEFYRRYVNVVEIPESTPGFYKGLLRYRTKSA